MEIEEEDFDFYEFNDLPKRVELAKEKIDDILNKISKIENTSQLSPLIQKLNQYKEYLYQIISCLESY